MIDRTAVVNNAKYLRNVRPIDPDELVDYLEESAHPGVVRRILREEAFDLGLFERPDGTFVPVADEPVHPRGWEPESFPEPYAFAFEELLVEQYGPDWHTGATGDRLRTTIDRLKADYFHGNDVTYDEDAAFGYAIYHLPDYYAVMGYVLEELAEPGHLPRRLRVLDVGAGTGGPALGLCDYLFGRPDADPPNSPEATSAPESATDSSDATGPIVDYHAVEPSANADVLEALLEETDRNFRTEIHRERIEAVDPASLVSGDGSKGWDLVVFGNVLSELEEPQREVERGLDALAESGSLVALAPADLETSTGLRAVERALARDREDVTVYAPELRLWPGAEPSDRGWSFAVAPDLEVPSFQRLLDEAAPRGPEDEPGRYVNVDVQYSYSILRRDGRRRFPIRANTNRHARMAESDRHVTRRIDLLAVKLSENLADGDANPLFRIGDGSQQFDHYAVLTRESGLNRALREAPYGAVLEFQNALLLWNDDEGAYNLVVDGETTVDIAAA
ncbi:methyltransferase family protein [Halalkaliarchaeum desulfuricum]|uniref:Methyltransferase family protein n=1 Tax=Halalkaliarchaeum desulfuricum TaxID=2055893 RepID=A0A343TN05_9EURY|nr:SAM-dependent methyltransferase [Halalkaliarchaeum desulfuricum]AUX10477.1 methyltransferase family protein [Halalkaliarchaeum desulfuricum]